MNMKLKKNIALSESGFVFDPTTGDSYSLNQEAREVVRLMNDGKELSEITDYMVSIYDVGRNDFEKYFFDFASMLRQFRLLEDEQD
ncbi:MAG: PqqD family protein [Bacteroidales bacterium]|nr:PqqD family protein [Bacteroidales bacterium]